MKVLSCPSSYERYLASVIVVELDRIRRDVQWREDFDDALCHLAPIPAISVDPDRTGDVVIIVGVPDAASDTATITNVLRAASPCTGARTPRATSRL